MNSCKEDGEVDLYMLRSGTCKLLENYRLTNGRMCACKLCSIIQLHLRSNSCSACRLYSFF